MKRGPCQEGQVISRSIQAAKKSRRIRSCSPADPGTQKEKYNQRIVNDFPKETFPKEQPEHIEILDKVIQDGLHLEILVLGEVGLPLRLERARHTAPTVPQRKER